jgi:hypothetical protein
MALVAGTLIEDAELHAYPYLASPPIPRPTLLRTLQALDAEIVTLLMTEAPHALSGAASAALTIAAATNVTGYTLDPAFQHQQFMYWIASTGRYTPLTLVTVDRQDDVNAKHPAAVVLDEVTLFPVDPLGKRWAGGETRSWFVDGDKLYYRKVSAATTPATLSATLQSPDYAEDFFSAAMHLEVLLRYPGQVPERVLQAAEDSVKSTRLLVVSRAVRQAPITSRFGETSNQAGTRLDYRR